MPGGLLNIRHTFEGGLATDFGGSAEGGIGQGQQVKIPFLVRAENIVYNLQGGPKKIGGVTKGNSVALEAGAVVRGLYDYWAQGISGSPTQKRIIHVGTKVKADAGDFAFVDILSGMGPTSLPHYNTFDDLCLILSDEDVPQSYDGAAAGALAGTPPNASFSATHRGRVFMAGVDALPSRLYYGVAFTATDYIGAGSGYIDVDPDDGDRILAIISHKKELWVFKGPYKGSIHRITGSAPTGADAFALEPYVASGLGCVGPHALFVYRDDVGFVWNDGSVYSLKATAAFGDYSSGALSLPINRYLRANVNPTSLYRIWCAVSDNLGGVRISLPIDSESLMNQALWMDFRFDPVRWSRQPAIGTRCQCLARVIDSGGSGFGEMMAGGDDGFVRRLDSPESTIDETIAIAMGVETPKLGYGDPIRRKTIYGMSVGIEAAGSYDLTLGWTRDLEASQTFALVLGGGGDVLAPASGSNNPFILDQSLLGGLGVLERFATLEFGDEFSSIVYSFDQGGLGEPVEITAFTAALKISAESMENS